MLVIADEVLERVEEAVRRAEVDPVARAVDGDVLHAQDAMQRAVDIELRLDDREGGAVIAGMLARVEA